MKKYIIAGLVFLALYRSIPYVVDHYIDKALWMQKPITP